MTEKWYKDGILFECIECGDCCRTHGDYAFVYLSPFDVMTVAAFLRSSTTDFLNAHCKTDEEGWVHLTMCEGDCNFLDEKGRCKIYMVRPKQCATWPFWTENLADEETWNGPIKACCPGIGKGKLYTPEEVEAIAKERDDWYGVY